MSEPCEDCGRPRGRRHRCQRCQRVVCSGCYWSKHRRTARPTDRRAAGCQDCGKRSTAHAPRRRCHRCGVLVCAACHAERHHHGAAQRHGRTCRRCGRRRQEHTGPSLVCPGGSDVFLGHLPRRGASASFAVADVLFLDELLELVQRGGDVAELARTPAAARIATKVATMKAAARKRRAQRKGRDDGEANSA